MIHFDPKDILRENSIGLWVMRVDTDSQHRDLHVDETLEEIMGLDRKCTPRECFHYWSNRIEEKDSERVREQLMLMMETGKMVLVDYGWEHPTLGSVMVRCSGKRVQSNDGMAVAEGYFRIISNVEGAR